MLYLENMFLPDFVLSDLSFYKSNKTKELADLIIKVNNNLLCFQVKRTDTLSPETINHQIQICRIKKRINRAAKQLEKSFKRLQENTYEFKNPHGVEFNLELKPSINAIGIIILDLAECGKGANNEKVEKMRGVRNIKNIVTHILFKKDFDNLVTTFDTLTNFLDYLENRAKYYSCDIFSQITLNETSLVNLYFMSPNELKNLLTEPSLSIYKYLKEIDYSKLLYKLNERKKYYQKSYIIDEIIRRQHLVIGHESYGDIIGKNVKSQNVDSYK